MSSSCGVIWCDLSCLTRLAERLKATCRLLVGLGVGITATTERHPIARRRFPASVDTKHAVVGMCVFQRQLQTAHGTRLYVSILHGEHAQNEPYLHHTGKSRPPLRPRLPGVVCHSCPGTGGTLAGLTLLLLLLPIPLQTLLLRPRLISYCLVVMVVVLLSSSRSRSTTISPDNPLFRAPALCPLLSSSGGCSLNTCSRDSERRLQAENGMARGRAPGRHEEPVLPRNATTATTTADARSREGAAWPRLSKGRTKFARTKKTEIHRHTSSVEYRVVGANVVNVNECQHTRPSAGGMAGHGMGWKVGWGREGAKGRPIDRPLLRSKMVCT